MIYEIIFDGATAQIETKGAELQSLKDIFGTEYIWNGDAKYWGRRAPVLFPIIGKQIDYKFEYDGKFYPMKNHGFARDSEFEMISQNKNSITFSLVYDEETLKIYPFKFRFQVIYTLEGAELTVEYRVANLDDKDMYFSIGGHTAFNCPLMPQEKFDDYIVEFEKDEYDNRILLGNDELYSGKTMPLFNGNRSFRLSHPLFDNDAIVPDHIESKSVTLKSTLSGRGVRLDYEDFENLAVWSIRGESPFVCLEPWIGRASSVGDSHRIEDKYDIIKLAEGSFYKAAYKIFML